jgi:hypothetical protein
MPTARPRPWSAADVGKTAAGNAVGFALILMGWFGASRHVTLAAQSRWAVLSVAGLAVAGAANAVLLREGRRAVGFGYRRFLLAPVSAATPVSQTAGAVEVLVSGGSMTMFHRPECRLVAAKLVRSADRAAHHHAGRRPCEVCRP